MHIHTHTHTHTLTHTHTHAHTPRDLRLISAMAAGFVHVVGQRPMLLHVVL